MLLRTEGRRPGDTEATRAKTNWSRLRGWRGLWEIVPERGPAYGGKAAGETARGREDDEERMQVVAQAS